MILNAHYPHDIRVDKEAKALIDAGFKVHLLCSKRDSEPPYENLNGLHVHRIKVGTTNVVIGIWDVISSFNFVHPLFNNALPRFIRENNINILHVHDLPLVKTALVQKKKFKIKVIADFHENYPEAMKVWFSWKKNVIIRLKNRIFFNYKRWLKYENFAAKNSDKVIAVVEEMKERLIEDHNIEESKISVITNSESLSFLNQKVVPDIYGEDFKENYKILYAGGIGPHRGVDTAIEGMKYLKDNRNIVLVIVGSGSGAVMNTLYELAKENNVLEQVKFLGYKPFSTFYSYMSLADVNIIPHLKNGHTDHTIPHKLFQGMMCEKPVLVSSSTPLKRTVESLKSGLTFEAGNPKNFAAQILNLYNNRDLSKKLAKNGFQATVRGNENWEVTSQRLVKLYKEMKEQYKSE